jgi:hypothetical protein
VGSCWPGKAPGGVEIESCLSSVDRKQGFPVGSKVDASRVKAQQAEH